uniref:(northern house mosquito) hypothetical protein n=1 Tax=Culex pipiens TaxID=7175 RepID=A0A8D8NDF8_CULPI
MMQNLLSCVTHGSTTGTERGHNDLLQATASSPGRSRNSTRGPLFFFATEESMPHRTTTSTQSLTLWLLPVGASPWPQSLALSHNPAQERIDDDDGERDPKIKQESKKKRGARIQATMTG